MKKKKDKPIKKLHSFFKEFKDFALRGDALNLAIGVVIGAAFSAIVKSIVDYIIMPIVSLITFNEDIKNASIKIINTKIQYGELLSAIINFIAVAFIIFLFVKFINKIMPKKDEPNEDEIALLKEIRDSLKKIEEK